MRVLLFLTFFSCSVFAGISTSIHQSAPVLDPGKFEAKLSGDIIFNRGGGFNISPHLRTGLWQHFMDVDLFVGTGTTDFMVGGLFKYNLLPDVDHQAAVSFLGGPIFLRDNAFNSFVLSFGVLVSKELRADWGMVEPYGAYQLEFMISEFESGVPMNLSVGSRVRVDDIPWVFYSELGMNIRRSFWSLGLGAGYPW